MQPRPCVPLALRLILILSAAPLLAAPPPGSALSTAPLASAERIDDDGSITAYGVITDLGIKEGKRFLRIDYVEWLSEEECERRVATGTVADLTDSDCSIDSLRVVNQNPRVREFSVADPVRIRVMRTPQRTETLSWDALTGIFRARAAERRELWDGLWEVHRRGPLIERIDWLYQP